MSRAKVKVIANSTAFNGIAHATYRNTFLAACTAKAKHNIKCVGATQSSRRRRQRGRQLAANTVEITLFGLTTEIAKVKANAKADTFTAGWTDCTACHTTVVYTANSKQFYDINNYSDCEKQKWLSDCTAANTGFTCKQVTGDTRPALTLLVQGLKADQIEQMNTSPTTSFKNWNMGGTPYVGYCDAACKATAKTKANSLKFTSSVVGAVATCEPQEVCNIGACATAASAPGSKGTCHAICRVNWGGLSASLASRESQCKAKGTPAVNQVWTWDASKEDDVCATTTCTAAECCKQIPSVNPSLHDKKVTIKMGVDQATFDSLPGKADKVLSDINTAMASKDGVAVKVEKTIIRRRLSSVSAAGRRLATDILVYFQGTSFFVNNIKTLLKPFPGCNAACINSAVIVNKVDASVSVFSGMVLAIGGLAVAISSAIVSGL